jgi:hypothetical protein
MAALLPLRRSQTIFLVLPGDWDFDAELSRNAYHVVSKKRVRKRFGFDILVAREDSRQYSEYVELFCRVRGETHLRKGILRVEV